MGGVVFWSDHYTIHQFLLVLGDQRTERGTPEGDPGFAINA